MQSSDLKRFDKFSDGPARLSVELRALRLVTPEPEVLPTRRIIYVFIDKVLNERQRNS